MQVASATKFAGALGKAGAAVVGVAAAATGVSVTAGCCASTVCATKVLIWSCAAVGRIVSAGGIAGADVGAPPVIEHAKIRKIARVKTNTRFLFILVFLSLQGV